MTDCLKRNLTLLADIGLTRRIEQTSPSTLVSLIESREGAMVPQIEKGDQLFALHSRFKPVQEGMKYTKDYSKEGIKIFLGLGGAFHIIPFLKSSTILIVEPSLALLRELLSQVDYSDILESVSIVCEPKEGEISRWIRDNYIPIIDGGLDVIPLRSYGCDEKFNRYTKEIQESIKSIGADCSTQKKMGRLWQRNIIFQTESALSECKTLDLTNKKAILTAAGPGLSYCRSLLEDCGSDTIILSVDTALPTLLSWGITPDYVVALDPQFIGYLHHMNPLPPSCTVVLDWGGHRTKGVNIRWMISSHPLCQYLKGEENYPVDSSSGVNVTQASLSLLAHWGVTQITLLGADFSYPQGKPYVEGSYFFNWFEMRSQRTASLEGQLAGFVFAQEGLIKDQREDSITYTTPRLMTYKEDFFRYIDKLGGQVSKIELGWNISLKKTPPPHIDRKQVKRSGREALTYYQNALKDEKWRNHSTLTSTLIPLAYHFLEGNDSEGALEKARQYTLTLLKDFLNRL